MMIEGAWVWYIVWVELGKEYFEAPMISLGDDLKTMTPKQRDCHSDTTLIFFIGG